ncbi:hypothetical protein WQ57_25205 [Mesobacillus campisalis]|uniref:SHOCT domain-containing protein n=1 Tax=Mesobacillus campisalis TaxID=1408103 RepID=A0A0M2SK28_9BACI|nr:hypothetical protein [Mesobacillus campisalis]KKK33222.1 hypothetical protein WQ57_25205 [Mesobacillus campisalis]
MLKKWLSIIMAFFISASFVLNSAQAQERFVAENFPYKEMTIQVMPEFDYPENWKGDKPSLLSAFYGTITNESGQDFKGELEFPVPAEDGNFSVYLVAEFPAEDKPEIQRPHKVDKEKGVLTWQPAEGIKKGQSYQFVIEYYSSPFMVSGAEKEFEFSYNPPAGIDQLNIIVFTPVKAEAFKLNQQADNISKSDYGQELHYFQYSNVKKDKPVSYTASYIKDGHESTLSLISKQNPPNDENHNGSSEGEPELRNSSGTPGTSPIIGTAGAIIIGISVIIAGAFIYYGLMGKAPNTNAQNNRSKTPARKASYVAPKARDIAEEKKQLRNKLLTGKIDEKTYEEKMRKLI